VTRPRVLVLHGINTDGADNIDLLGERLMLHHNCDVHDVPLAPTRWYNGRSRRIVRDNVARLAACMHHGDHVICHSNGGRLAWECMNAGLRFGVVSMFSAALNECVTFRPCAYERIVNFHNPRDKALFFGSVLPGHIWGGMGRGGYKGISLRVVDKMCRSRKGLAHSHWFASPVIEWAAEQVMAHIAEVEAGKRTQEPLP
jgi:hypothetical protein